ncbi:MAG: hypothetical protein IKY96_07570 [Oscillospiraceae bacterium]|nr:hypothetical protein [Oscillospiraceae bacterium]
MDLSHLEPEAREFLRGERFCGAVGMGNLLEPLSDAPRRDPPLEACHVLMTKPERYCAEPEQIQDAVESYLRELLELRICKSELGEECKE